jgi:hypothetical protein
VDHYHRALKEGDPLRFHSAVFDDSKGRSHIRTSYQSSAPQGIGLPTHKQKLAAKGFHESKAIVITWNMIKIDADTVGRICRNEAGTVVGQTKTVLHWETIDLL